MSDTPTPPTEEDLLKATQKVVRGLNDATRRQLLQARHDPTNERQSAFVASCVLRAAIAYCLEAGLGTNELAQMFGASVGVELTALISDGRRARKGEEVPQPPFDLTALIADGLTTLGGAVAPETPAAN